MEKQRAILESVIKEEIDFISYVDLADGMVHTIVPNEDADVMPPIDGDYQRDNSTEYRKRATNPENTVFSGFSLYSENLSDTLKTHENVPVTNR